MYMQPPTGADLALLRGDGVLSAELEENSSAWQYKPCLPFQGLITLHCHTHSQGKPHTHTLAIVHEQDGYEYESTQQP